MDGGAFFLSDFLILTVLPLHAGLLHGAANGLVERYEKAKARLKARREAQAEEIGAFLFEIRELDTFTEFDETLWLHVIDTVTVNREGSMLFRFKGGTEISI